ncbi:MAG: CDP-alcohol phosphatidyltransferase family protein [Anaeromicrobium sp.]|uniref:CDP-alcohol phosphatidyltransferase family protein n=1 Tax=Anaeromicrobium sp. TaxID=1929132 RepID=UPI0025DF62E8|nr:CDP-alcohol phosphatidyltransferase family protein [Anaeromicrobium sp.]MCT4595210.1 CDP-alcohol phosphatidyltransferase family protein [Anaeromicrobium sp.]
MLDTYGRKYVNPIINNFAKTLLKFKLTPNWVTVMSLILGFISALLIYWDITITGVVTLWISGFLDSVDGAMARIIKKSTSWGTLMDITFDRLVEMAIIITLAIKYPHSQLLFCFLLSSIIFSMTIFLTVGALSHNNGIKSFRYQAGFAERTEGFIFLSSMIVFTKAINEISIVFTIAIVVTALQRMVEAKKILDK